MKTKILVGAVSILIELLDEDRLRNFADYMLDFGENYVLGTKSKVDDAIAIPIFQMVRKAFDIPDKD